MDLRANRDVVLDCNNSLYVSDTFLSQHLLLRIVNIAGQRDFTIRCLNLYALQAFRLKTTPGIGGNFRVSQFRVCGCCLFVPGGSTGTLRHTDSQSDKKNAQPEFHTPTSLSCQTSRAAELWLYCLQRCFGLADPA